jgi:hypothetical protein
MADDQSPPVAAILARAKWIIEKQGLPAPGSDGAWEIVANESTPELRFVKHIPSPEPDDEDEIIVLRIAFADRRESSEPFGQGLTVWACRMFARDQGHPYRGISTRVGFAPVLLGNVVFSQLQWRIEQAWGLAESWQKWEYDELQPLP